MGARATAGDNGWAIGGGEEYTDLAYQDDVESRAIYDLLEQEIVPLFYTRGRRPAARLDRDDEGLDADVSRSSTPTAWSRNTQAGYASGLDQSQLWSADHLAGELAAWARLEPFAPGRP